MRRPQPARWLRRHAPETLSVAGLAAVAYGTYTVHHAAGVIVGGVSLLIVARAAETDGP